MAMTREEFAALVKRLESVAAQDMGGYRTRVGLLAAAGYAFILFLLTVCLVLIGGIVWLVILTGRANSIEIRLALVFGGFAIVILRSLWVTFEKPEGIPLVRATALPLFQSVDRLTERIGAPRFHHVLLTPDFNAAVVQHPRLGIFGWQENYLLVGLPLMQALSPAQFEGVLAHELGHLRGGHGRFGAWIYRVNRTWMQLLQQLSHRGAAGNLLKAFFGWYAPYFHAYSFILRRMDEYEADRCAAQSVGSQVYADALCLLPTHGDFVDKSYWKQIYQKHQHHPLPVDTPFTGLIHAFRATGPTGEVAGLIGECVPPEEAARSLKEALAEETGFADTHPSLSDRLKALRQEPRVPVPFAESAAESFFGPHLPRLASQMDAWWQKKVSPRWQQMHQKAQQEKTKLAELDAKAKAGPLPEKEAWAQAEWTEEYAGDEAAMALYRAILERTDVGAKYIAAASFALGNLLLAKDDPEGITYLQRAMATDAESIMSAQQLLYNYYRRQGNEAAAKEVYANALRQADIEDEADRERQGSGIGDRTTRYLPHGLTPEQIGELVRQLAKFPDVGKAYIVRKELKHFPERPLYVLGIDLSGGWIKPRSSDDYTRVRSQIARDVRFPGQTFVLMLKDSNVRARITAVHGAFIYEKPK